jgi:hypothetical protein
MRLASTRHEPPVERLLRRSRPRPGAAHFLPSMMQSTRRSAASAERTTTHPRPTYGIFVAITVMNSTFASNGSPAM